MNILKHNFISYTTVILDEKFETSHALFSKSIEISLLDIDNNLLQKVKFAYANKAILQQFIAQQLPLNFDNCFLEIPKELPRNQDGYCILNGFSANNSFIVGQDNEINFSKIIFENKVLDFTETIFFSKKINFSDAQFTAKSTSFEYCSFIAEQLTFHKAKFTDGDVSFKNTYFSDSRKDFEEMHFGKGLTSFVNAEFYKGDVLFTGTVFGHGKTTFKIARFGTGRTDFSRVVFWAEETSFEQAQFGDGDVSFRSATFKNGRVNFVSSKFGTGKKSFINTQFGNGNVHFKNSNFGSGKTTFRLATFGYGIVDFHFSEFKQGDIIFDGTKFSDGGINFRAVHFGTGRVSFKRSLLGNGNIIFEGISLAGRFIIQDSVFGNGEVNFAEADLKKANVLIQNVDFGIGKISFKDSKFNKLSLKGSQLDNYFDLRMHSCKTLDLSDTVVKGIVDLDAYNSKSHINEINLDGMRLLGRIYIDWYKHELKKIIHHQKTSWASKAEQFRILKENYSVNGQYDYEDEAYVEFKRAESKAILESKTKHNPKMKPIYLIGKFWEWLIFDKMGKYATDPIRVLIAMLVTYIGFSLLYVILGKFSDMHIISALFPPNDPRVMSIFPRAFYHSAITFLTIGYGDYYPSGITRWISAFEGFVGLFQMSYFTVAFVRKMLR